MKTDDIIKKETMAVIVGTLILSAAMEAVFLVSGIWWYGVLLSNALVSAASVLNFYLMGITVQKAVADPTPEDSKRRMKASQALRLVMMAAVLAIGAGFSKQAFDGGVFDLWALIPAVLFNRIIVMVRGFMIPKSHNYSDTQTSNDHEKDGEDNE